MSPALLFRLAWPDVLERTRRAGFLLTVGTTVWLGSLVYTNNIQMWVGEYRGVVNSAWLGTLIALSATTFVSLAGFYVVKTAVERDRLTGVGQILAATRVPTRAYLLAKWVSNFAVLAAVVLTLAVAAVILHYLQAETVHLDPGGLLAPLVQGFGQQAALTAGIGRSSGRGVILIDADLQGPPEVIPVMIDKWKDGYEVVYARRTRRCGEPILKRMEAAIFYRLLNRLTDGMIPVDVGDFRLLDSAVCDAIKILPERNRYLRGLVSWVGFKQAVVEYSRQERCAGSSKYFFTKRLRLAADALLSFSNAPLKLLLSFGCLFSLSGLILLIPGIFRRARHR